MNVPAALREADQARRAAMISGDALALDQLLADDLTWTHSSGKTETKAEFIAAIVDGHVTYESLAVSDEQVRSAGDALVHGGMLHGRASRGGQPKALAAKFLAVWRNGGGGLQLVAWQSTNLPDA